MALDAEGYDSDEVPPTPEEKRYAAAQRKVFLADLDVRRKDSSKILAWLHGTGREMLRQESDTELSSVFAPDLGGLSFGTQKDAFFLQEPEPEPQQRGSGLAIKAVQASVRVPAPTAVHGGARASRPSERLAGITTPSVEMELELMNGSIEQIPDDATPIDWAADPEEDVDLNGREIYLAACRKLSVTPASKLLEKLDEDMLDLGNYYLGGAGGAAVAACMERNAAVTHLDLSHTKVGQRGGSAVLGALVKNMTLLSLDLSGNHIFAPHLDRQAAEAARLRCGFGHIPSFLPQVTSIYRVLGLIWVYSGEQNARRCVIQGVLHRAAADVVLFSI